MPQRELTERTIAKLKAKGGEQTLFWDSSLAGFGILCSGRTGTKSYVVKGSVGGRSVRRKIGRVGVMKLAQAREEAKKVMVGFSGGIDPRQKKASAATLRQVLDGYLKSTNLKPRSREFYFGTVTRHLGDWLNKPIGTITREMVERRHRKIAEEVRQGDAVANAELAKRHLLRAERTEERWPDASERHRAKWRAAKQRAPRSGEGVADGAMRCLRALFNHAIDRDPSLTNSVLLKKQWFGVKRRERLVKFDDLARFHAAVMGLENPITRDYLRLLLFTGLRRREAAGLKWSDVDLRAGVIRIPAAATKSGRKLDLPMSDVVRDLLIARRSVGDGKFVFLSANSESGHLEEPKSALAEVATACGVKISVHDLRRTFLSVAESCDISPIALKGLANHAVGNDVTAGYVVVSPERLREAAQKVADKMKELCQVPELKGIARLGPKSKATPRS
jgi:integrase